MKKLLFTLLGTTTLLFSQAQTPNDNIGSGNALAFDGNDEVLITAPHPEINISGDLTLELWINPTRLDNADYLISNMDGTQGHARYHNFQFRLDNGKLTFYRGDGTNFRWAQGTSTVPLNEWTHVAVVHDISGTVRFYINGIEEIKSVSAFSAAVNTNNRVAIGAWHNNTLFYDGTMDEVKVWNVARTPAQIRDDMNKKMLGNETGLMGYWNLNNGIGGTVTDLTSSGNNGTLQ